MQLKKCNWNWKNAINNLVLYSAGPNKENIKPKIIRTYSSLRRGSWNGSLQWEKAGIYQNFVKERWKDKRNR